MLRKLLLVVAVSLAAGSAGAQTPSQLNPAGRGTELGGSIGAADTVSDTGLMIAGTADWRLTRWLAIEAAGGWFARGAGPNGASADIGALVNLVPHRRNTPAGPVGPAGVDAMEVRSIARPFSGVRRRRRLPASGR